jgi:hypothetical protein
MIDERERNYKEAVERRKQKRTGSERFILQPQSQSTGGGTSNSECSYCVEEAHVEG